MLSKKYFQEILEVYENYTHCLYFKQIWITIPSMIASMILP